MQVEVYGKTNKIKFSDVKENNGWKEIDPKALKFAKIKIPKGSNVDVELDDSGKIAKIFLAKGETSTSTPTSSSTGVTSGNIVLVQYREDNTIEVKENGKPQLYQISDAALKYGKAQVPAGSTVEITVSDDVVTNIKKKAASSESANSSSELQSPDRYSYPKTITERAEINAQSVGHMVSRTISGLVGAVDPNNVHGLVDELFNRYAKNVSDLAQNLRDNKLHYQTKTEEE